MHNHADDDYQWPTCGACKRELWHSELDRQACRPCQEKTATRLGELPAMFAQLNTTAALMRSTSGKGGQVSGSRTPPIPPNEFVLSLVAAGGVASRLRDVEDSWRASLGWTVAPWRGSPGQAVPVHVEFLSNNLLWACSSYESVDQDVKEIKRLHAECTAALSGDRRPGRVNIGLCPVEVEGGQCAAPLTATTASHRVQCGNCGTEWADMGAWRELRRAQEAVLATDAGVAA